MELSQEEKDVLRKMLHYEFIGGRHTSIDNLPKSFPKHDRGKIKKAAQSLARKGFFIMKQTSYGLEVSVNPRKIEEISMLIF